MTAVIHDRPAHLERPAAKGKHRARLGRIWLETAIRT